MDWTALGTSIALIITVISGVIYLKVSTNKHTDNVFETNRAIAKAEKETEALEQQAFCSKRIETTDKVEKRVDRLEDAMKVTALGVNILVKSHLNEKINGEVKEYKDSFDKYFIEN